MLDYAKITKGLERVEQYLDNYNEFVSFDDFNNYCKKNGQARIGDSRLEEIGSAKKNEMESLIYESVKEYLCDVDDYMNSDDGLEYDGDEFLNKKY